MPQLTNHSTPAERRRGATWAISGGVPPGTAFDLTGTEFNSDPLSIMMEFTPTFNWDANADIFFFQTTAADDYRAYKRNNAGANAIRVELGNTFIADIPSATYSPFWLLNQRNVLVISGNTGNTSAWLNGNAILVADPTGWNPDEPVDLAIGSNIAGGDLFTGTIHSFQVYRNALLTAQEAADFYNRTTYSYMDTAVAIWQMRMQDHDPVGALTLDSSGNGNDATLLNTPVKDPARHGYVLNGTNESMSIATTGLVNSDELSIVIGFRPDFLPNENAFRQFFDGAGAARYYVLKNNNAAANTLSVAMGNTVIGAIAQATYEPWWRQYQSNVMIVTGDSVNDLTNVWLNEGRIMTDDPTAWAPADPATFYIASGNGPDSWFDGDFTDFMIFPFVLTELQMWDIRIRMQLQVNKL
jgi:hypothetical protein